MSNECALEVRTRLGYSQNHLAVAGGYAVGFHRDAALAPTRYREVVLTLSNHIF